MHLGDFPSIMEQATGQAGRAVLAWQVHAKGGDGYVVELVTPTRISSLEP